MPGPSLRQAARADWFAARALLAMRRLRPFVPIGLLVLVLVFAALLAARKMLTERASPVRVAVHTQDTSRDTLPLITEVQAARARFAAQDSAFQALLFLVEADAATPVLAPDALRARDSLRAQLVQLESTLGRAAKAPLVASYRELASTRAVSAIEGVAAYRDTLAQVDRARQALDPAETPQGEFAKLTQRANAIGAVLQNIGYAQRALLLRKISTIEGGGPVGAQRATRVGDTSAAHLARDRARAGWTDAEARLRDVRQWHAAESARVDSVASARATRVLGVTPAVVALSAMLVAGVLIFTLAVSAEARRPTIAHAREVERLTGVPVLGTAYLAHLPPEGRARLRLGTGLDPFRMVYLALTASGTRARTVCIAGDDPDAVAAVVGRLAVSAATDERATLAVDLASGTPSATRYFGGQHEPGFSEAICAIRLWREVARPVGASEGLGLDVVPAGARRADTGAAVELPSNRREFHLFASEYDFTVLAAPTAMSLGTAVTLYDDPATIYVARVAETPLDSVVAAVRELQGMPLSLHGVLLVDAQQAR